MSNWYERNASKTHKNSIQPTDHQVAGAQEQNYTKDVDHAGGEDAIPGAEKHWLPHEQLDPPPRLARLVKALQTKIKNAFL